MFGIGFPEMVLILVVSLVVVGPKNLPDLAKTIGNAVREFKKVTYDIKENTNIEKETKNNKKEKDSNTTVKKKSEKE